jgi:asparagine synthase (glutamine-hydrolysing)
MSGFVVILDLHQRAVDRLLLQHLTDFLSVRGPDARASHADGPAGLGFALLATAEGEPPLPRTLDGNLWITGDVRLDGRADLLRRLRDHGATPDADVSDADLILHAYERWGEQCVEHLLGDFAFAIWDARRRSLYAARDHFGIKPFYYATVGGCLLASNMLACLRQHPDVSARLNEQAIGDFLTFGFNHDLATTTFADLQRLPAAHSLSCRAGRVEVRRYWQLPCDGEVRCRPEECVEQFRELLWSAVADRLRTPRAGVLMSGGLDSTSLAAVALEQRKLGNIPTELHAFTLVYDRLIPDEERHYSALAAGALGLPIHILVGDPYAPYMAGDSPLVPAPEPIDEETPALLADLLAQAGAHGRVVLTGFGGDPLLYSSQVYMMNLLARGRWLSWLGETTRFLRSHRRFPPLGLRGWLKRRLGSRPWQPPFPEWFNPEFAERLQLRQRWQTLVAPSKPLHPRHGEAHQLLTNPQWPALFESLDAGFTHRAVDVRHPFFDVRLVKFVLALPPLPWCVDKEILRTAMTDLLPDAIRRRPKAPLAGDPLAERVRRRELRWADYFDTNPLLDQYVNRGKLRELAEGSAAETCYAASRFTRPLSLSYWLDHYTSYSLFSPSEDHHDRSRSSHAHAQPYGQEEKSVSVAQVNGVRQHP